MVDQRFSPEIEMKLEPQRARSMKRIIEELIKMSNWYSSNPDFDSSEPWIDVRCHLRMAIGALERVRD